MENKRSDCSFFIRTLSLGNARIVPARVASSHLQFVELEINVRMHSRANRVRPSYACKRLTLLHAAYEFNVIP